MRKQLVDKLYAAKMKRKKIIVIGGSGDLGQSLIPKLVSNGFDCISISRKSNRNKLVKNIKCDITNFRKLNFQFQCISNTIRTILLPRTM